MGIRLPPLCYSGVRVNFHDLETSAGFGFRFNVANTVFLRFDVGFSHEGFQYWMKFGNPF